MTLRRFGLLEENRTLDDYTDEDLPSSVREAMAQGKPHVKARRLRDGSGGSGGDGEYHAAAAAAAAAADDDQPIKLLKEFAVEDFKRAQRAIAVAHRVKHPGIVPVECAFVSEGAVIVQSPYYLGGDMHQWAKGKDRCDVLVALWQVAEALEYLHGRNILHRDIKPGNVVFETDRPLARPALCDFDLSVDTSETQTSLAPSTYLYMPEEDDTTPTFDVYSLGVSIIDVIYCGGDPDRIPQIKRRRGIVEFDTKRAIELVDRDADCDLGALVKSMINPDPDGRPVTKEVAAHLRTIAESALREREEWLEAARRDDAKRLSAAAAEKERRLAAKHAADLARVTRDLAKAKVGTPAYWKHRDVDKLELHQVPTRYMKGKLQAVMNASRGGCCAGRFGRFEVTRVTRIENSELWQAYATKRSLLAKRAEKRKNERVNVNSAHDEMRAQHCNADVNEVFLFHGTDPAKASIIAKHGFDERVASLGGLYGAGTYFADRSCKSNQYAGAAGAEYTMFYSRVLLGNFEKARGQMSHQRRPSEIAGSQGRTFDAVVAVTDARGGQQVHPEFIVYDRTQAYPEFLIHYKLV